MTPASSISSVVVLTRAIKNSIEISVLARRDAHERIVITRDIKRCSLVALSVARMKNYWNFNCITRIPCEFQPLLKISEQSAIILRISSVYLNSASAALPARVVGCKLMHIPECYDFYVSGTYNRVRMECRFSGV